MGIRLDWEIEAEKRNIQGIGEDPDAARKRRRVRARVILTMFLALGLVAAAIGFVVFRIEQVDRQIETLLRDTVSAEVTALRIGDRNAFEAFQYSAAPNWLTVQRQLFDEYQTLIVRNENAELTGQILDIEIDDPRGRVQVQEIVDGVPYTRTWFYWRYEPEPDRNFDGGWRHVPPDFTFWGEEDTLTGEFANVFYSALDAPYATMVADRMNEWMGLACGILTCEGIPTIQVAVIPDDTAPTIQWSTQNPWQLDMISPFATRARSDMPFSPDLQIEAARTLAERLVRHASSNREAVYPFDAYFLQQSTITWLLGRFVLIDTQAHLIQSFATLYGEQSIGQLLQNMPENASISILGQITGTTLDQTNLDWRDFFTWRLQTEQAFIAQQDTETVLNWYDRRDEAVLNIASSRLQVIPSGEPTVTLVEATTPSPTGQPQLLVTVNITEGDTIRQEQVVFRLVDNIWLRAS